MQHGKVVSLAEYKARLNRAGNGAEREASRPHLEVDSLWELLDRNICLLFWKPQE